MPKNNEEAQEIAVVSYDVRLVIDSSKVGTAYVKLIEAVEAIATELGAQGVRVEPADTLRFRSPLPPRDEQDEPVF